MQERLVEKKVSLHEPMIRAWPVSVVVITTQYLSAESADLSPRPWPMSMLHVETLAQSWRINYCALLGQKVGHIVIWCWRIGNGIGGMDKHKIGAAMRKSRSEHCIISSRIPCCFCQYPRRFYHFLISLEPFPLQFLLSFPRCWYNFSTHLVERPDQERVTYLTSLST